MNEFPPPTPRPKLEITFDDLEPATPRPRTRAEDAPPPPAAWPPPPTQPAKQPAAALPPAWPGAAPGYPSPTAPSQNNSNVVFAAMAMNHKSPGVAVLLSLLFTGAGQVYCGRAGRGIAFFFGALFSAVLIFVLIGFILLPIVWIWAAIDASNLAKQQNAALMAALAQNN